MFLEGHLHKEPDFLYTVGLQGSGKTRYATNWVMHNSSQHVRVNRDDLRCMVHPHGHDGSFTEEAVTEAQLRLIAGFLNAGYSVISDDTNLNPGHVERMLAVARQACPTVRIRKVDFTNVPLEVCIQNVKDRVAKGGRNVPEAVIRQYHVRWLVKKINV